jgi:excisionase family DNA binding protein
VEEKVTGKQKFDRCEAADYCGVSIVTIDRALAGRKISCFRIGRRVVFSITHLDEFLARNECKAKFYTRTKGKSEWLDENQELALSK